MGDATPQAGWYPDPAGGGGERYWDGQRWTGAVRPSSDAAASPPPAAEGASMGVSSPDPGDETRSRTGMVLGGVAVVVLAVTGVVVATTMFQGGAASPQAAVQELVDGIEEDDLLAVLDVVAPDEVDWARELIDHLPDLAGLDQELGVRLELTLGEPREVSDGLQVVPVDRLTLEAVEATLLTGLLGLAPGERVSEDLRDDPDALVVTVQRAGGWYVSPVGTLLEMASRAAGLGGASAASDRRGAADPTAVADDLAEAVFSRSLGGLVDLIDPDELMILDHYPDLLRSLDMSGLAGTRARATVDTSGSTVTIHELEVTDSFGVARLDLRTMCVDQDRSRDCLVDELQWMAPWDAGLTRALLQPDPMTVELETVERDGRSYLSLAGTLDATVIPAIERLGEHGVAAIFDVSASPHVVEFDGTFGEVFTLDLHDNWNAIVFPDLDEGRMPFVCGPEPNLVPREWDIDGQPVEVSQLMDDWRPSRLQHAAAVGVVGPRPVDELQVRVVDVNEDRC